MFKNNRSTRKRCQWRRSAVFIVNFEHISHLFLRFLLPLWRGEYLPGIFAKLLIEKSFNSFQVNVPYRYPLKHLKTRGILSSNVNEVIRAVLNSLSFLRKDFARTKSTKSIKSTKSTKAQRRHQAKAQDATSEQKFKMRLKNIRGGKSHLFTCLRFCAFCARKENKIK